MNKGLHGRYRQVEAKVLAFESGLHQFLKTSHGALIDKLNASKAMDKDSRSRIELNAAIRCVPKVVRRKPDEEPSWQQVM